MADERFSPKAFLKSRRPERFSDSSVREVSALERSLLEYHLDTLTSRSQESDFEEFARHLAERAICPNLLPHTGPAGGGDSKVDTETYPVADSLTLAWFSGLGREAADDRWAFAFSAKKDWRSKVQSDVAKIAATGRGYTKAFFITNQFVADKARASIEDSLRKKHHIDVRILDRQWIVDTVFTGRHEDLAVQDLQLTGSISGRVLKGPRDTQREGALEGAEKRINDAVSEGRLDFALVETSIEAALLARGLELPRLDVDGRFDRATRLATQHGSLEQQLESAYQHAWTTFWWFEDPARFSGLYEDVERLAIGSTNPYDLERLNNLWFVLQASVDRGDVVLPPGVLASRTATLIANLERLATQSESRTAVLQAEALLIKVRLVLDPTAAEDAFAKLRNVVHRSDGLVGFPLSPLVDILIELGSTFGDSPAYELLYEDLIDITARREGEIHAARLLLTRGVQHLDAKKPYEAIASLGRALVPLYKYESRRDLTRALYLCGAASARVGLLWASRGMLLHAASIATSDFTTYGDVTPAQAECFRRIKWIELQLGRVAHALAWHEVDRLVRNALAARGYEPSQLFDDELPFDAGMGVLFLASEVENLRNLSPLPDILERLDLPRASVALLYALGYEEQVEEELKGVVEESGLRDFFKLWKNQPIAEDLPPDLYASEERRVTLRSTILGCQIEVTSEASTACIEVAETVLAALESFLSTGLSKSLISREPRLAIDVRASAFTEAPFTFELRDKGGLPEVEIRCALFKTSRLAPELQSRMRERLLDLLANIVGRVLMIPGDKALADLIGGERALERALNFTWSFIVVTNVLGEVPKFTIAQWKQDGDRDFPLKRDRRALPDEPKTTDIVEAVVAPGEGDPPEELLTLSRIRHDQIQANSLIREALWNRARWSGTAFIVSAGNHVPPILAPMFRDGEAAKEIFSQWRKELGRRDNGDRLRVTVIRCIDRRKPHAYRVVIGSNVARGPRGQGKIVAMLSRINTMEPSSSQNLERFLASYDAMRSYLLAPAIIERADAPPRLIDDLAIELTTLHVRQAWEIGRNDFDSIGVTVDDDPIIPAGQGSAPVLGLLKWLKEKGGGVEPE